MLDMSIEPGKSVPSRWRMRAFRKRVVVTTVVGPSPPKSSSLIIGASLSSVMLVLLLFVAGPSWIGGDFVLQDVVGGDESCRRKVEDADDVVKELDDDEEEIKPTREDSLMLWFCMSVAALLPLWSLSTNASSADLFIFMFMGGRRCCAGR